MIYTVRDFFMKRMLLVVNPYSGQKKAAKMLAEIVGQFNRADYAVQVYITGGPGDAIKELARLCNEVDLVVCCGGDGTFNETLSGLLSAESKTPIGYIPTGSTNDFASSLKLPLDVLEATKNIIEGQPVPYDAGRFGGRVFSYVASFGAFTKASYSASQETKNALGHFAYILEGIKNLDSLRPYRCGVEADGESFDGDFIFGAVCNSTSLGGLVKLDPKRVHMDDGMFELILLRMPKTALDLQNLITALNRMDYDYPGVIFRHVRSVTVTTREDIPWSLDGEYAPSAPRVEIRNLHSAVQLMIQDDE